VRRAQRRRCFERGAVLLRLVAATAHWIAHWIAQSRLPPRSTSCSRPPDSLPQIVNQQREPGLIADSGRCLVPLRRVRTVISVEAVSSTLSGHLRGAPFHLLISSEEVHRCRCVSGSPERSPECQSLPLALRSLRRKSNGGRTVSVLPVRSDAREQPNDSVQPSSAEFLFT